MAVYGYCKGSQEGLRLGASRSSLKILALGVGFRLAVGGGGGINFRAPPPPWVQGLRGSWGLGRRIQGLGLRVLRL